MAGKIEAKNGNLVSTADLVGRKVWMERPKKKDPDATKKMGRVRACVFHPQEKRCVGFIVKRPDLALMFHRKDLFVAYNGYDVVDGAVLVHDDPAATDKGACNALGVNWDDCVLWVGMPVMCQDGTLFGTVGSVTYCAETGRIFALDVNQGAAADTLLGVRRVPAELIRGFRRGAGAQIVLSDEDDAGSDLGAILVDDDVKKLPVEGGLAEKAGAGAAVAADKAHKAAEAAKPKVTGAVAAAGEAASEGAFAMGRQLERAQGMFSDFKSEFDKASGRVCASGEGEPDEDAARLDASSAVDPDENTEYVFVDEDGNIVEFVDEDGNVITDPALIGDDFVVEEAPSQPRHTSAAESSEAVQNATAAMGDHLKKAGGMFSAFKEEYDKARRS